MLHKKLLIILFTLFVVSVSLYVLWSRFYPWELAMCTLSKGNYRHLSAPLGAPQLGYKCVHRFSDGGKKCFSNDDCEGNCLLTEDTVLEKVGLLESVVVGGSGACEEDDLRHPSYPGDFDNPIPLVI